MSKNANELRKALEELFERQTQQSRSEVKSTSKTPEIPRNARISFEALQKTVATILSKNFEGDFSYAIPDEIFIQHVRKA